VTVYTKFSVFMLKSTGLLYKTNPPLISKNPPSGGWEKMVVYSNPVYELFKYFPTHSNHKTFLKFKTMAKNNKNVRGDSSGILAI